MRHRIIDTPTGLFAIIQQDDGSLGTTWVNAGTRRALRASRLDPNLVAVLARKLKRYFAGHEVDFTDVPTPSGPEFFAACWNACRRIKRGRTVSYAELAQLAGSSPSAARAAGQAMRRNPLPVIVPCHRVVGADGKLHGFGGSCDVHGRELGVKLALLRMENARIADESSLFQLQES